MKDMLKLLQRLEEDCTLSNAQLAALVNCSEDEVAAVRRELEEQRIILGYKAIRGLGPHPARGGDRPH